MKTISKSSTTIKFETQYGPFIDGEFVESSNGYIDSINPATGELLSRIARGGKTEVDEAVRSANIAFESWSQVSVEERSAYLHKIADALEENKERFCMIDCLDTGRPIHELSMDYGIAISQFRYFASAILMFEGTSRPITNGQLIVQKDPLGVCAQIIPWNVPMIMVSFKLAPALAAGNTIVMKPAEDASLSTLELAKILKDILPKGVVNFVPGYGIEAGEALMNHSDIHKLSFTGSVGVGRLIGKTAGERLMPVTLELGGKSPHIVFPDVDIDSAVENVTFGYCSFNGQSCILGSRLFIHDDIYDEFIEKLVKRAKEVKVGDPTDPSTRVSSLINEKQGKRVLGYIEIAKEEGAKLLVGGNRITVPGNEHGYFIEPTIFEATNHMRISQEEIFGPVLTVMRWNDIDTVIKEANDVEFGLAAGIMTKDFKAAIATAQKLQAGSVWINQYFNFQTGAPFGGFKNSGLGREYGKEALDEYTQVKTIAANFDPPPTGFYS
ncbi:MULTISPECIES: aldehyde dehydrogenase [unclassified Sporosarcina]|uniref:aldehyde dehydrogenase family protein n=1 Tax=unclassified Sporosarcina TaxID=2647733 RepID=UPI00203F5341|nr:MULTISPECIES: aldehyde dehydrogenase family protein [unclassified Sporosarcina]GKV65265.1 aldehyde dehydrogenase [Sporosarcina sp. NCCP-2331]GLB55389.1 aldehyde dehydrogenase [Sporosarcina sp. NCCP-2378]